MIKKLLIAIVVPLVLDATAVYFVKRALDEVEFHGLTDQPR